MLYLNLLFVDYANAEAIWKKDEKEYPLKAFTLQQQKDFNYLLKHPTRKDFVALLKNQVKQVMEENPPSLLDWVYFHHYFVIKANHL